MKSCFIASAFMVLGCANAQVSRNSEVKTVENVDLRRYVGQWHEIASIPQSFQKQCVGNTKAEYSFAENSLIKVLNSCDTSDGSVSREYAWLLARQPLLPLETLKNIEKNLKAQAYDTCKILTSIQTGGFEKRTPLCKVAL